MVATLFDLRQATTLHVSPHIPGVTDTFTFSILDPSAYYKRGAPVGNLLPTGNLVPYFRKPVKKTRTRKVLLKPLAWIHHQGTYPVYRGW